MKMGEEVGERGACLEMGELPYYIEVFSEIPCDAALETLVCLSLLC